MCRSARSAALRSNSLLTRPLRVIFPHSTWMAIDPAGTKTLRWSASAAFAAISALIPANRMVLAPPIPVALRAHRVLERRPPQPPPSPQSLAPRRGVSQFRLVPWPGCRRPLDRVPVELLENLFEHFGVGHHRGIPQPETVVSLPRAHPHCRRHAVSPCSLRGLRTGATLVLDPTGLYPARVSVGIPILIRA